MDFSNLFKTSDLIYIMRVLFAALCGAFIGIEREKRFKTAGIRTHILVAVSSCMMMIVSKYGFFDVLDVPNMHVDASRIAAQVVTAIGFLGAGVIFVRKESITGVTTAAGLWATVGVGIAMGAGMYVLAFVCTAIMLLLQLLLHHPFKLFTTQFFGTVKLRIPVEEFSSTAVQDPFTKRNIQIKNMTFDREEEGKSILVTLGVVFPASFDKEEIIKAFRDEPFVNSIEIYPAN